MSEVNDIFPLFRLKFALALRCSTGNTNAVVSSLGCARNKQGTVLRTEISSRKYISGRDYNLNTKEVIKKADPALCFLLYHSAERSEITNNFHANAR